MRMALKLFRIKNGLSQGKIAEKLGYHRNQYAKIENGRQGVTLKFLEGVDQA